MSISHKLDGFFPARVSFGATSAVITSLGLITGLDYASNAKPGIIGGILVIAVADNISDSLGIHVYQESQGRSARQVMISTLSNFFTRLVIALLFVAIVYWLPIQAAVIVSLVYGVSVLSVMSLLIARRAHADPWRNVAEHLLVAAVVIVLSHLLGQYILSRF